MGRYGQDLLKRDRSVIQSAKAEEKPVTKHPGVSPMLARPSAAGHRQVIGPPSRWQLVDARELWRFRDLAWILADRDIKIRYKQTVLGAAWAVLQPLAAMIIFSIFFGRFAGLDARTGDVPYFLFVLSGLLPWTLFASALGNSSLSVVTNPNLVTKVYFPRLIIPLSSLGSAFVDFAVSFAMLVVMVLFWNPIPSWQVVVLPVFLAAIMMLATGLGAALAGLTVLYRDFRYVVPVAIQLWMFVTPVIYPASVVPEQWRWLYAMNPMSGLVEGFRSCILGTPFDWPLVALSMLSCIVFFMAGTIYFRSIEHRFADAI
jgi:lipopolysaccharide transport system permease protein